MLVNQQMRVETCSLRPDVLLVAESKLAIHTVGWQDNNEQWTESVSFRLNDSAVKVDYCRLSVSSFHSTSLLFYSYSKLGQVPHWYAFSSKIQSPGTEEEQQRVGERCKIPSMVRGKAPAEVESDAFLGLQKSTVFVHNTLFNCQFDKQLQWSCIHAGLDRFWQTGLKSQ